MAKSYGFYKGYLEQDGFKTMFIVYASSSDHAVKKAMLDVKDYLAGAQLREIEGPYMTVQL